MPNNYAKDFWVLVANYFRRISPSFKFEKGAKYASVVYFLEQFWIVWKFGDYLFLNHIMK